VGLPLSSISTLNERIRLLELIRSHRYALMKEKYWPDSSESLGHLANESNSGNFMIRLIRHMEQFYNK